jgi:hypothetical protein
MKILTSMLAGGIAIAAVASAAPAAAQYYPGYGYGYGNGYGSPYGGNVVGQVLNSVVGGGYGNYGVNSQAAVNQCAAAVQQRLSGGYGYGGYGYGGYGNVYGGNARVLGISRVEPRGNGGLTVRGVASSGRYAGYSPQAPVDLTWRCSTDYRGVISDISVDRAQGSYGYNGASNYSPYGEDYSQYGYHRY